jgi:acetyltransferase
VKSDDYGIAARNFIREMGFYCPDGHMVQTLDGAIDVAATIHYPVVLKALVPGIHHKSDVGAVEVNLRSPSELGSAWEKMKTKFGKVGCLVEKMVPNGPEILLGFKSDPRYGPIVIVGWGGYSTELVNDVTFLVPPFTEKQVSSAIGNLKISKMLSGFRASQKIDPHHLVNAVLRMGDVAQKYYRSVAELEINPLIVSNDGTWAVDALLVNFISKEG